MKIERDADDVCLAFLLERTLHERGWETAFDGEVVGVISSGAFVRFGDEGFEGFLPVRRIRGDWYQLNDEETALIGESSGRALRYGDALRVQVGRVEARPRPRRPPARARLSLGWQRERASARPPPATSPPTARRRTATTCSRSGSAGSCSRARRSSRCARAACS